MAFRDVVSVDSTSVRDRQQRFDELFRTPSARLATDARRIADESARSSLGVTRNMNVPTAPLVFLEDTYVATTRWSIDEREAAASAWTVPRRTRTTAFSRPMVG